MRTLNRHRSRAGVALILILGLLGMGTLDAEVCRGEDGHLGIDTRLGSCCDATVQQAGVVDCCASISAGDALDLSGAPSLASNPESVCVDTPWVHGTPTTHAGGLAAGCPSCDLPAVFFRSTDPSIPRLAALSGSGSILSCLRTTTLLI
jgi:hypothetical protein